MAVDALTETGTEIGRTRQDLRDRVAIVTGGARGIGLQIAATFAGAGARVVIADALGDVAETAARELRETGLEVDAQTLDVTRREECQALVDQVLDSAGRVDALVNSAGVALYGPSESFSEQAWQQSIDVMLSGPFFMAQAVASPMFAQKRGAIINLASITGVGGWPMRGAYNAAKAGLIGLTEVLAAEWAQHNVRVNSISPGPVQTDMMREAFKQGVASQGKFEQRIPVGRLGVVADIAGAALFLASDRSSFVTGANLRVDGGWLAWANPDGEGFPAGSTNG